MPLITDCATEEAPLLCLRLLEPEVITAVFVLLDYREGYRLKLNILAKSLPNYLALEIDRF